MLNGCAFLSEHDKFCINSTPANSQARTYCLDEPRRKEAENIERQNLNARLARCEGYGFKRGTTPFAQCMQQAEQQESMNNMLNMQQNELNRQEQERNLKKSQCYFSGKLNC